MKRKTIQNEIQAYVRQVWLAGIGLLSLVQKESVRVFKELVEEGKKVQTRHGKAAHSPAAALKTL